MSDEVKDEVKVVAKIVRMYYFHDDQDFPRSLITAEEILRVITEEMGYRKLAPANREKIAEFCFHKMGGDEAMTWEEAKLNPSLSKPCYDDADHLLSMVSPELELISDEEINRLWLGDTAYKNWLINYAPEFQGRLKAIAQAQLAADKNRRDER